VFVEFFTLKWSVRPRVRGFDAVSSAPAVNTTTTSDILRIYFDTTYALLAISFFFELHVCMYACSDLDQFVQTGCAQSNYTHCAARSVQRDM